MRGSTRARSRAHALCARGGAYALCAGAQARRRTRKGARIMRAGQRVRIMRRPAGAYAYAVGRAHNARVAAREAVYGLRFTVFDLRETEEKDAK